MPRWVRIVLVLASMSTLGLGSRVARAQTTATTATTATPSPPCGATVTAPTVTQSAQVAPNRYVNNVNLGTSTRPNALTPNGISYSDCTSNMQLRFQVEACGFLTTSGAVNLEVWASTSTDCTATTDRGISVNPICWKVTPDVADLVQAAGVETIQINVRDIVAYQTGTPPTTYTPAPASVCTTAQPSYTQVPINLNFIPIVASTGAAAGPAYQYQIITDLVGPPPPSGVMLNAGDTLVVASWTPNVDTDTTGYDVVIDPEQGQGMPTASGGATQVMVCPDSGTATTTASADASQPDDASLSDATSDDAQSADSSSADATVGATTTPASTTADAGCHLLTRANTSTVSNGGSCNDLLLTSTTVVDSGVTEDAAVETTPIYDEAGDLIDSSVVAPLGSGGIWVPPANHVVDPDPTIGTTVAGASTSTHTVTGLVNGVMYTVVVAAVDALGNVGPPSTQECKQPKPVNDFWKIYRGDGGGAGGGFCALEAVGAPAGSTVAMMGAGALALAAVRRRRSKRR